MSAAPAPPTIAAIATPPGRGGVGIVRVSGTRIDGLVQALVGRVPRARVATACTFRDAAGAPIDSGLAIYFAAPQSYTGETVLELHGHGGPAVMRALLARCIELGARLAEPGEFTKRAFLNGKLDLAQAESVADLIEASTSAAARAAARSLTGEFSREVDAIVGTLTTLRMYTEATLDFPEEDLDFIRAAQVEQQLSELRVRLDKLLQRARAGARLREGLTVVLAGRPNVGKSSLLNRLVREEAAIVTPTPGTTRDTVERQVELRGVPLTLIDTAGLRATADSVERIGIERALAAIEHADLLLWLVEASDGEKAILQDEDVEARLPRSVPRLIVHNKIDLVGGSPCVGVDARSNLPEVRISALTGEGLPLLEAEMARLAGVAPVTEDTFLARERHLDALRAAAAHLDAAARRVACDDPALELFAEELREAQVALASVTGEFTADDLLGVIFSRFCIGK
ncbi:MAG TPA: tRNA uridine-5-carboxymethylaminomethyl(34) synthesis GTPase MnmE [Casimicrobiaceae bacterium]|nr:tRNA uridine-5-carboxymethylaminomethyl(34) synthesis GTPase MnmE [Casimicrobiaceae bacterium]